jgi:hypothetical protein
VPNQEVTQQHPACPPKTSKIRNASQIGSPPKPPPLPDGAASRAKAIQDELREKQKSLILSAGSQPVPPTGGFEVINGRDLMEEDIPPLRWMLPGLMPEGLTLFCGGSKLGKSWLSMRLALTIASGGSFLGQTVDEPGRVLYLGLEDGKRRLQNRFRLLCGGLQMAGEAMRNIDFVTRLKGKNGELITPDNLPQAIRTYIANGAPRLIVIDTLGRVKQHHRGSKNIYDSETQLIAPLQELAVDHGIGILLVHHTNKSRSEDSFDRISGSTALMGVADTTWMLERPRMEEVAMLSITGRDIEEAKLGVRVDTKTGLFELVGDPRGHYLSGQQKAIFDVLTDRQLADPGSRWVTAREISAELESRGADIDEKTIRTQLERMAHAVECRKRERQAGQTNPPNEYALQAL